MSTTNSYYFRRRIGRAASPPTWACYEQIPCDEEDDCSESGSESCSEDEEDYTGGDAGANGVTNTGSGSDSEDNEVNTRGRSTTRHIEDDNAHQEIDNMDIDEDPERAKEEKEKGISKDVKGKQRAVDPPEPAPKQRQRRKRREPVYALRPILTIQRSQGFVWNQDLFVPPYIKDRYVASTSPPNSRGFISTSASSTNSALTDYEVEVVEIRVKEGELSHIIP
ncbi:hypothetical protein BDN72DRAFT_834890 [Pluteus cervinus]|uniref:Uncharacterized protein n=1 Tax=Pluteus cervinus TaxID=181527 RepID=A0ACD3B5Z5_9AGAR|nr:hypothetical protein BDN72DRAFT_834890 [Pluteus cervinus]